MYTRTPAHGSGGERSADAWELFANLHVDHPCGAERCRRDDHARVLGDDTAIPAIGTVLEAIPRDTRKTVVIEVVDEDDERQPSDVALSDPIWLHRGTDATDTGIQSLNLIRSIAVPPNTYWWIAGEREAIRTMRDVLVNERAVDRDHISLNAYWRLLAMDPRER